MKLLIKLLSISFLSRGLAFAAAPKKSDDPAKTPPASDKPTPTKEEAKAMHLPLKGTVTAITTRTLTLKGGEGKEDRKFTINKETQFVSGEAAATVADVKVGQAVTGSYLKNADGTGTLMKLQISPKPAENKKKGDAKGADANPKKGEATEKKPETDPKKKTS